MKAALWTTLAAVVAATALAAPASAATPTERKLNKQVKTLQSQVKKMQKQVKTLQTQMREVQSVAAGALIYSACLTASTADAFQGTWETIDRAGREAARRRSTSTGRRRRSPIRSTPASGWRSSGSRTSSRRPRTCSPRS